ncbi:hypothetical protein NKH77_53310 [Streptomyces sp. M19]
MRPARAARRRVVRGDRVWTVLVTLALLVTASALAAPAAAATGVTLDPDVRAWNRSGRPDRLMVIRPHMVGLLDHGVVVRRLYRDPAPSR